MLYSCRELQLRLLTHFKDANLTFLSEITRLNVSISRARYMLIIIGSLKTLEEHKSQHMNRFVSLIKSSADMRDYKDFL